MTTITIDELKRQIRASTHLTSELDDNTKLVAIKNHEDIKRSWESLEALATEIGKQWPKNSTAAQAIADERRELVNAVD